jgi:hexosaminidase
MTMVVLSCASLALADAPQLVPAPRKLALGDGEFVCKGDAAAQAKFETDAAIPKEGYRLSVAKDGIRVASSDEAGRFYALETLKQLAAKDGKDGAKVPCVEIEDSPRYSWLVRHGVNCAPVE